MNDPELQRLRQRCHTVLPGHRFDTPATQFRAMAAWCEVHQIQHDQYGEGDLVQAFEHKMARLLGLPAAQFCITGTMIQCTALRLACQARHNPLVALHPSSHILLHEHSNYQIHRDFVARPTGHAQRVWTLEDLQRHPETPAAALYELPMREIGGQLPDWESLQLIKRYCQDQNIHLHLDGARLWEAATGYGRPLHEVVEGFDSVYVSFYKGVAGLGGGMLLGQAGLIERARLAFRRQGGNVFRSSPYVVAAAMAFDERLAQLPACLERTRTIYRMLRQFPSLRANPATPQVNMLHLHLPLTPERATEVRNRIAEQQGIWLFNQAVHGALPGHSVFEWYVGDQALAASEARLHEALDQLHQACLAERGAAASGP